MTVRLAKDVGMPLIAEYAKRFGVYDDMRPFCRCRSAPARPR
jgi:penicillin-binding protein 1A